MTGIFLPSVRASYADGYRTEIRTWRQPWRLDEVPACGRRWARVAGWRAVQNNLAVCIADTITDGREVSPELLETYRRVSARYARVSNAAVAEQLAKRVADPGSPVPAKGRRAS